MKILLTNYRYFVSGGPERYLFNIAKGLTDRGHEVIPFSIRYSRNHPSPYSRYFVDPIGGEDEVYFREQKKTPRTIIKSLTRLFYARDVETSVSKLIKDTKPDTAYVLHFLRKLSPSLLVGIKKEELPIVVRLSDYAMLCPQAHFLRNEVPCELCITGNLIPSVKYKCVQDSLFASLLNYLATKFHKMMHYFDLIDCFVVTNSFMYKKMIEAGFSENLLVLLPTYVDCTQFHPVSTSEKKDYFIYCGRITPIKGVHILLEAYKEYLLKYPASDLNLSIVGRGDEEYVNQLQNSCRAWGIEKKVTFWGELASDQIASKLRYALFSVVPSLWYENLPNSILESFASGTPVIASNLGTMSECIENMVTGTLFTPGDPEELAKRIADFCNNPSLVQRMSAQAREVAQNEYSEKIHLDKLELLFSKLLNKIH
jgi:glycosyltransferase involved in cell wall biosynthesis